jgi:hypothetical protein
LVCLNNRVVDGSSSNKLIEMIMNALLKGGGLTRKDLSKKVLCFEVNDVNVFQGGKIKVTKQIKDSWAPIFHYECSLCCS